MLSNEPLLTIAGLTALASAIVALAVAFGVPLSADQTQAVLGFVAVLAPLLVGFVARRSVTPAQRRGSPRR